MHRLVYIATHPITAFRLMDGQLAFMKERGFDVTVITAPGPLLDEVGRREGVRTIAVPMQREMSPAQDVVALGRLVRVLGQLRPTLVNAGTPKGGLLGVTAARLCRVPIVVYLLRGLRFEGASGLRRLVLSGTEHVAGHLAHRVFVNGESLRQRFTALGCAQSSKTWVPAHGSSNGVEVERFVPSGERSAWASATRERLAIPPNAVVVGFVGRFTRDKGIVELLDAFESAARQEPHLRLLLVGDHDATDPLPEPVRRRLQRNPLIVQTGFVNEPSLYYALMDVFAFPSHREGLPNAPLEAAAAELPVVAYRVTGTVDVVVDGVTGQLLSRQEHGAFEAALLRYARQPALRKEHGLAGRRHVTQHFQRENVWQAIEAEYRRLIAATVGA